MAKQDRSTQPAAGAPAAHDRDAQYVRFSLAQRLEHIVLLVSFTALALTGLPQKFVGNGTAEWFIGLFGGIETIRTIHHTAAIVFILMSVYDVVVSLYKVFVLHIELTMLPGLRDLLDAVGVVRYNLGLTKERPQMPRYSFDEKVEYWAMVWGTLIMALTGFMLWNPIMFTKLLPGEFIPAAKAAHGAEAILAVLAIIIWHFYNVHLKSWNTSMWTGKMSEHHMAGEHGEELAMIKASNLRPRPAPAVIRQRMRAFVPVAAVISVVLLASVYWLATAEKTAITTVPTPAIKAYVPLATPVPDLPAGLSNAQIGLPIPHPVAGREQCDTCHGPKGVKPYPADHVGRPNVSCLICHSTNAAAAVTAGTPATSAIVTIPHPVEGRQDCLMCHKTGGVAKNIPADHAGRTNETCTACHQLAAGISGTPAASSAAATPAAGAAASGPKAIPANHAGRGPETCAACHAPTSAVKPAPQDHAGRTGDTCAACHKPAGSASTGGNAGTGAPTMSHITTGAFEKCTTCHGPNGMKPAPADHTGRTNDTCVGCHVPGGAAAGSTATIATGATPAAAATAAPAASSGPAAIPADHAGRAAATCVTCHAPTSAIKPAPADHAGRTGDQCAACHKAS